MSDANTSTRLAPMARLMEALARLLRRPPRPRPHPLLTLALLPQVPRLRTVHQLHQLRSLAASWLPAAQLRLLDLHLQERLHQLAAIKRPPSRRSTSSRTRTARRTGKRRR